MRNVRSDRERLDAAGTNSVIAERLRAPAPPQAAQAMQVVAIGRASSRPGAIGRPQAMQMP